MTITKDIKVDFGAVGNGVANDDPAFISYRNFCLANNTETHVLTIPAGTYNLRTVSLPVPAQTFPSNIKRLTIQGNVAGTSIIDCSVFRFGGMDPEAEEGSGSFKAFEPIGVYSAYIESCGVGSTAVKLVTPAHISTFLADSYHDEQQMVCIAAFDMQGAGYPPNNLIFEYNNIARIDEDNAIIYLQTPLQYGYSSTYPVYADGTGAVDINQGGPATIFRLLASHETELIVQNMVFDTDGQHSSGRSVTLRDCDFLGHSPGFPSGNETALWENVRLLSVGTEVELDKMVDSATFRDCTIASMAVQSSSTNLLTLDGGTYSSSAACAKNTIIQGSTIASLNVGPGYGQVETVTISDATISAIAAGTTSGLLSGYTFAAGEFRQAMPSIPPQWASPGQRLYFADGPLTHNYGHGFTVTNVSQDGSELVIATDLVALPAIASTLATRVVKHPCINITVTNSTGCNDIVNLSLAPAGEPLFQYVNQTVTGDISAMSNAARTSKIWGELVRLRVNVTQAYTGVAASPFWLTLGPSNVTVIDPSAPTVLGAWHPVFNLRQTGLREITPTTNSGAQSGDLNQTPPGLIQLVNAVILTMQSDITGESSSVWPIVNIELITDQGIDNTPWDTGEAPYHGIISATGGLALE